MFDLKHVARSLRAKMPTLSRLYRFNRRLNKFWEASKALREIARILITWLPFLLTLFVE